MTYAYVILEPVPQGYWYPPIRVFSGLLDASDYVTEKKKQGKDYYIMPVPLGKEG